jgi:hypothetical protein
VRRGCEAPLSDGVGFVSLTNPGGLTIVLGGKHVGRFTGAVDLQVWSWPPTSPAVDWIDGRDSRVLPGAPNGPTAVSGRA